MAGALTLLIGMRCAVVNARQMQNKHKADATQAPEQMQRKRQSGDK